MSDAAKLDKILEEMAGIIANHLAALPADERERQLREFERQISNACVADSRRPNRACGGSEFGPLPMAAKDRE
jgi:hypothetical protein